jgi:hypothetical protein
MPISSTAVDAAGSQFLKECHTALHQHTSGNPRPYLNLSSTDHEQSMTTNRSG